MITTKSIPCPCFRCEQCTLVTLKEGTSTYTGNVCFGEVPEINKITLETAIVKHDGLSVICVTFNEVSFNLFYRPSRDVAKEVHKLTSSIDEAIQRDDFAVIIEQATQIIQMMTPFIANKDD